MGQMQRAARTCVLVAMNGEIAVGWCNLTPGWPRVDPRSTPS